MLRLLGLLAPYVVWFYPLGVLVLLVYLRAWLIASRDYRSSLFSLERETAVGRMRRAATGAFGVFGALMGLFVLQFYLGRSFDLNSFIRPTPTSDFMPVVDYGPTPGPGTPTTLEPGDLTTPSPTATRRPTPRPITLIPSPTPSPEVTGEPTTAAPASCSSANVQILEPGQGAVIRGTVDVRGTANIPSFQFYKLELGLGEHPTAWTTISDVHRTQVVNGLLEVWNTSDLPAGSYSLRLVVVDVTGNFPPPCEVQVVVAH